MKTKLRPALAAAAALALLAAIVPSTSAFADGTEKTIQGMVEAKYQAYKAAYKLPEGAGVILRMETPKGSFTASAGLPSGADETWHFRIASVSKTFTAAAIMLLDQEGRLDIDDRLTDPMPGTDAPYLADSPNFAIPYKDRITIRQLLSHRAGVFDVFNNPVPEKSPFPYAGQYYNSYVYAEIKEPDHQFTAEELAGVVAANGLSSGQPGAAYHYSDTGYTLLAKIVERVSGMSYDRFLADRFWKPLGLSSTSAPWNGNDASLPDSFLPGFVGENSEFMPFWEDNMSSQVGPGNIISTPEDLTHWIRAILSGRGPLSKEQIARMGMVPKGNPTYALGLGNTILGMGHSGAHPGYVNLAAYNPNDDVGLVVATPFIDYARLAEHLAFLVDVGREARALAGYPGLWEPSRE